MKKTEAETELVETLSFKDLCRFCQAEEAWVMELVEEGVLEPSGEGVTSWRFEGLAIARAKRARRLVRDLGVNTAGIALVLDLLDEREAMMRRLSRYEGR